MSRSSIIATVEARLTSRWFSNSGAVIRGVGTIPTVAPPAPRLYVCGVSEEEVPPPPPKRSRRRVVVLGGIACGLAVGAIAIFLATRPGDAPRDASAPSTDGGGFVGPGPAPPSLPPTGRPGTGSEKL